MTEEQKATQEDVVFAEMLARRLHRDQVDRRGQPYVGHLERVADRVTTNDEKVVAWLHDSLEDCYPDVSTSLLGRLGVPYHCKIAILVLTRLDVPYEAYIRALADNPLAVTVKLADLADHLDPERRDGLTPKLLARYTKAQTFLQSLTPGERPNDLP